MKAATLPPLRVDDATRKAVESVLREGESLSGFVLEAVRLNIQRREAQQAFVSRGLLARDEARVTGEYVSADALLARLDETLSQARSKKTARKR